MNHHIVAEIKAAGFTHVKTYGPWVPLHLWTPYGKSPWRVSTVRFDIEDGHVVETYVGRPELMAGLFLGRWPLGRACDRCTELHGYQVPPGDHHPWCDQEPRA